MQSLRELLVTDHLRLDSLLAAAAGGAGSTLDLGAYAAFRGGLLRHIGMEEKILFPAARRLRGGEPLAQARQARLDHAALAALLAPTPTIDLVARVHALLALHNPLEEGPDGLHARLTDDRGANRGQRT
ncbi:MAG TPA: hemerythrin domain-containing protein [Polyangia bacterium]|nr:hemerythrin domain-containing protein [Polyangia bacterium]